VRRGSLPPRATQRLTENEGRVRRTAAETRRGMAVRRAQRGACRVQGEVAEGRPESAVGAAVLEVKGAPWEEGIYQYRGAVQL